MASSAEAALTELTFHAKIDNDAQAPQSFSLRYFIDKAKWEDGGPMLFYCGGWENIEEDTKNMVAPQLMAKELKAAVVFAEHRYYGKSLPYAADSFKRLGFIPPMRAFPSWPIYVGSFDKTITEIYTGASYTHSNCNSTIDDFRTAFAAIDNIGKTPDGLAQLSKLFALKPPLSSQADVALLKKYIREVLIDIASANLPYQSNVKVPLAPNPVDGICLTMSAVSRVTDKSKLDGVAATLLANVLRVHYNNSGQVSGYCVTPKDCPPSHDELARRWQECTQLPLWECSQGPPNDFFWPACTKDTFEATRKAQCSALFGSTQFGWTESMFQADYMWNTTQTTWYAGKWIPDIGNFFFTAPEMGPWWRSMIDGGIMHASKGIYYYSLEGVNTNADLYQPMDCDPDTLVAVRNQIAMILKCWSGQKVDYDCSRLGWAQPEYEKPANSGAICAKAQEPYSWEPQPTPTTPKGSSRAFASVLTLLLVALTAVL